MHPSLQSSLLRSASLVGVLLAVGCASADPDADSDERTGEASDAVDLAAINASQIEVAQDGSTPSRATGAVFIPDLNASHAPTYVASTVYGNLPVRGSCGVTFVSPHYAITASHCFSNTNAWSPATQTFTTKTYDVTQANKFDFYFDSQMTGTFPNYTPIFGHTMDQAVGYSSTTFTCKIASRCPWGSIAGGYNCDGVNAPDVTMLYCSSRPSPRPWLAIANDSATTGGAVYMYWFHELFDASNDADKTTHYTNFTSHAANWHYLAAPSNAFLPFKSVAWPGGAQRTRVGGGGDNDVRTDLYGCHGTSGSGVLTLSGGTYKLLGPVHAGGSAWAGARLCDDPTTLTQGAPGGHGLTYNSNVSVNALVNAKYLSILQADRVPPPVCGDGVCNSTETHATCPADCDLGDCPTGTDDCCGDGVCRTFTLCQKIGCL